MGLVTIFQDWPTHLSLVEFTLTYGEIDFTNVVPGYVPVTGSSGNGARFEVSPRRWCRNREQFP